MYCLALRFPFLQLEALNIDCQKQAVVVCVGNKITAATPPCLQQGVSLGAAVSTARALLDCESIARNPHREDELLTRICDALYAYTPYIQIHRPHPQWPWLDQGVLLELTRSVRLFHGIHALLTSIQKSLAVFNVHTQSALSDNDKAAWLLSYHDQGTDLGEVPVSQLHEFPEQATSLKHMGFKCLADVSTHVQKEGWFSFQKRFDTEFIDYLQALLSKETSNTKSKLGSQQELLLSSTPESAPSQPLRATPTAEYHPKVEFIDTIDFEFPVHSMELLYEPMKALLQRLCAFLLECQQQCLGITWCFRDIYQNQKNLQVRSERVYRDWQLLFELSRIQLERMGLPFEVDTLELVKPQLAPVHFETPSLDSDIQNQVLIHKQTRLMTAKLEARVGRDNVYTLHMRDTHIPELAHNRRDPSQISNTDTYRGLSERQRILQRPSWLLDPPVNIGSNPHTLYWHGRVRIIRGPEKIDTAWWSTHIHRDYFIAVREDHVRLWIFRDQSSDHWSVQGIF